jgi:hypothetical protein
MTLRSGFRPIDVLDENEVNVVTMERLERRLSEECGQLRLDIASLRTEVVDRASDLLRWLLAFFVAQTAALAALLAIFR